MKRQGKTTLGKSYGYIIIVASVVLIADLFILYLIKYKNQSLPIDNFSILNIGNILNLAFTLVIVTGLLIGLRSKDAFNIKLIISFTISATIFLIISISSTFIVLPLPDIYFYDHPLSKVITGFLFSFYQFTLFMFLFYIWLNLLGKNQLVFLYILFNAFFVALLLLAFSYIYIDFSKENVEGIKPSRNNFNVAVVLGAAVWSNNIPSPSLAGRVDKAADLYEKRIVDKIQLTGSNAPGELSEARVALNHIKLRNVDEENIWVEEGTTSTTEQIQFIKNDLLAKKKVDKVIIISDSYHLGRIKEICTFYKIQAEVAPSDLKLSANNKIYYNLRESIALLIFWFFAL